MLLRRMTYLLIMAIATFAIAQETYAQELNRERLRGNVRTINQGGLVPIDSAALLKAQAEAAARRDSLYFHFIDSVASIDYEGYEFIATESRDSIRAIVAARIKRDSTTRSRGDSIAPDGRRIRLNKRGEERKPFISDSMGLSKMCWLSLPLPGFGQIYNKQYWKLGILYPTVGASLGMFIYENKRFKPLKRQYDDYLVDNGYMRTPELDQIQTKMVRSNTRRQVYAGIAIASYIYFIGDAAINYATNEVSQDVIQSQRFYCETYQTAGRWICCDGKVATVFYYNGQQYTLPFSAVFRPTLMPCLKDAAALQMECEIDRLMLAQSGFESW